MNYRRNFPAVPATVLRPGDKNPMPPNSQIDPGNGFGNQVMLKKQMAELERLEAEQAEQERIEQERLEAERINNHKMLKEAEERERFSEAVRLEVERCLGQLKK